MSRKKPVVIGRVLVGDTPVVVLYADRRTGGVWRPAEPDDPKQGVMAVFLEAVEHPHRDRMTGDHHWRFGWACIRRAADRLNGSVEFADGPWPELPPGWVS